MSFLVCQFNKNIYYLKNSLFKVKRKFKTDNQYFNIFYKDEYIGCFDTYRLLTSYNNGKEIFFLIYESDHIKDVYLSKKDKLGTMSFHLNEKKFTWEIKYIKLQKNPTIFYKTRNVIIEKCTR